VIKWLLLKKEKKRKKEKEEKKDHQEEILIEILEIIEIIEEGIEILEIIEIIEKENDLILLQKLIKDKDHLFVVLDLVREKIINLIVTIEDKQIGEEKEDLIEMDQDDMESLFQNILPNMIHMEKILNLHQNLGYCKFLNISLSLR
jgi:hypothetical protein